MEQLVQQIEDIKKEAGAVSATDSKSVEEFRIKYLGTKGIVKNIMGEMKNVPNDRKKEFGQILNEFKLFVENKYEELKAGSGNEQQSSSGIDLTLAYEQMRKMDPDATWYLHVSKKICLCYRYASFVYYFLKLKTLKTF